jgi:hypothetical protein
MSGIKNPPPRFGLEADQLFDYATKQYISIGPVVETSAGSWDTERVAALIREGKPIEEAFTPRAVAVQPDPSTTQANDHQSPPVDPVDQANTDFNSSLPPNDPNDAVERANRDFIATMDQLAPDTVVGRHDGTLVLIDQGSTIGHDANGSPTPDMPVTEAEMLAAQAEARAAVASSLEPQEAPPV